MISLSVKLFFIMVLFAGSARSATFDNLFQPSWAADHFLREGDVLKLKLDYSSGAGFQSKSKYLYGNVFMRIKLVEGDSAGTVTAFYMASDGANRNEFDFEFLGNTSGEPYLVQTNIYINGIGNREERLNLWFDPTEEFHSYAIVWNRRRVVFVVDDVPVRVHTNRDNVTYPDEQPMGIYSSIWNADEWATQGGRVKTNWSDAPFIAAYAGFQIDACEMNAGECASSKMWWDSELTVHQTHQLMWVRANHLVYNYCQDNSRFAVFPPECVRRHH